ncbi:MAG TPA: sigma-70 family RNA polymerase sigma factor [Polyangiaceae bacterium]
MDQVFRKGPDRAQELVRSTYANRRLVEAIGKRLGVHEGDLPDLVQRVVVTVFRRHAIVAPGSEREFLAQVTRFEARHMLRSYRRRRETRADELSAIPANSAVDEQVCRQLQVHRLALRLAEMAEPMRAVWISHVLDGASCHQVAAAMSLPLGTVKSRLRRAWASLRENSESLSDTSASAERKQESHAADGSSGALLGIGRALEHRCHPADALEYPMQ